MKNGDTHDFLVVLGRAIVRLRDRKIPPMRQGVLAQTVGVEQAYISKVERGSREISLLKLLRICEILDVPLSVLLGEAEEEYRAPDYSI